MSDKHVAVSYASIEVLAPEDAEEGEGKDSKLVKADPKLVKAGLLGASGGVKTVLASKKVSSLPTILQVSPPRILYI